MGPSDVLAAKRRRGIAACVAAILVIHAALVAWLGARRSPNVDEPAHIAAGMAIWQYGSFEFYCVNPPLMRAAATLPILFMSPEKQWGDFYLAGSDRPEFVLGAQFVESHPDRWRTFFVVAGWAILPFSLAGGLFCYGWAVELFGRKAGLLALVLWCFCPNVLTWSTVICTDGVAAAMGVGAGYTFWRWLKSPTWARAAVAGLMLGLAELSKMTWLVLFVLWPALWGLSVAWGQSPNPRRPQLVQLAGILLLGLYVLNLGYAFDGSMTPLGEYPFRSRLLSGESRTDADTAGGNRFASSVLGRIPVPFPKHYVRGVDLQEADFEKGMASYLLGEWSERGWWCYYLVGLALKVPLGTWGLTLLALASGAPAILGGRRNGARLPSGKSAERASLFDQIIVLAPALAVLVLVSSQTGFSRHFRYVLPTFPFAFVWMSKVAGRGHGNDLRSWAPILICLIWSISSSMVVFPHSMSYFNELAGGPLNGHRYMLHSSLSWSQDDFYLKRWLRAHPEVDSPYMLLERSVSLERLGLRGRDAPPMGIPSGGEKPDSAGQELGPIPGDHVISVQHLYENGGRYLYFREFEPVARAGYSVNVYHITYEEANRVRRVLGIPLIERRHPPPEQLTAEMAAARGLTRNVRAAVFDTAAPDGVSARVLRSAVACDPELSLTFLTQDDIRSGKLDRFDVLIVPGGNAREQGSALGKAGREAIRSFVEAGGGYVGICAGAFLATAKYDWSLKLINAQAMAGTRYVPGYGMQEASSRGSGAVLMELTDGGRRILEGSPQPVFVEYTGGPVLSPANEHLLPDYVPLACYRSEVWKHPFQKGTMIHSPAVVAARFGQGHVILFSPHPETSPGIEPWLTRSVRACARRTAEKGIGIVAGSVSPGPAVVCDGR
jgi:glutamine amidotransferase-like uncharacterized protein